jgi:hypothetical protein
MDWKPVTPEVPHHDILLWADGRCVVGCLVEGVARGKTWRVFMDPRTDDLLPWPSWWTELPEPPQTREEAATKSLSSSE